MNIEEAVNLLHCYLFKPFLSRIYETKPLYYKKQLPFLNAVLRGYTSLSPAKLLIYIHVIEQKMGRRRRKAIKYGPRIIDIDILIYQEKIITTKKLIIPHPKIHERKFVLLPLLELNPYLKDPQSKQYFWKSLINLANQGVYFHSFSRYTKTS